MKIINNLSKYVAYNTILTGQYGFSQKNHYTSITPIHDEHNNQIQFEIERVKFNEQNSTINAN